MHPLFQQRLVDTTLPMFPEKNRISALLLSIVPRQHLPLVPKGFMFDVSLETARALLYLELQEVWEEPRIAGECGGRCVSGKK